VKDLKREKFSSRFISPFTSDLNSLTSPKHHHKHNVPSMNTNASSSHSGAPTPPSSQTMPSSPSFAAEQDMERFFRDFEREIETRDMLLLTQQQNQRNRELDRTSQQRSDRPYRHDSMATPHFSADENNQSSIQT
jgi:hypothetical protein